ncbi:hypothetical protein EW145_g1057 [Phellinidium pouzarii]|uniref:Conserved oligomeric Golgi complex subunit 4 n=1 Tax=Phellinidium pouzarii TaxID=167371 RepID=A0A4V3XDS2_9AGAM|nr:hypothetical protein EW145_g1057 [Phellinidium pouzarii]
MNGTLQSRPVPETLTTLPDILKSLVSLEEEEKRLSESLAVVLSNSDPIQESHNRLRSLAPLFDSVTSDVELLADKIGSTAQTAERVGGRVMLLDEEMKRVREAGERVAQVMELKTSLGDLRSAIDSQDWETATRVCARAMSLPIKVTTGPFAESAVPTADSPLPPMQMLQNFREQLRDIFLRQFQLASTARDPGMTTRFFKLFPSIGWEEEGLEAYADFVLDLVQTKSPVSTKTSSPLYYVTALTALFESVCSILDQHQSVVEKYYGKGRMYTVVKKLIRECDKVVKKLLDGWEEERSMSQKIAETALSVSPSFSSTTRKQSSQMSTHDDEKVDPRDIDKVLNEIAAMISRFSAFRRFLGVNLQRDDFVELEAESTSLYSSMPPVVEIEVIQTSHCRMLFDDLVTKYYIPLEVWYLRCTIAQAHKTSIIDYSLTPPTTTVPDLVFYILKSVLTRLTNMGSIRAVEGVIEQIRDVMENDYAGAIKHKLDDVYRNASSTVNIGRVEKTEKETRLDFIVSYSYCSAASILISSGKEFLSAGVKYSSFSPVNFIQSSLKVSFYVEDEDGYSSAEYQDVDSLTESNYRTLLGQAIDVLVRPWEKYVTTFKYTELGAIRFDRDIRAVSTYLSSQVAFADVREKFQRLQQISTLLNIDKDEDVDDFFRSSGIAWKLNMAEARAIAGLKL